MVLSDTWRTHRGEVTTTIHVAADDTAVDGDRIELGDRTGNVAVGIFLAIAV